MSTDRTRIGAAQPAAECLSEEPDVGKLLVRFCAGILVENARRKRGPKRGGGYTRHELDEADIATSEEAENLLALDEALTKLAGQAAVVPASYALFPVPAGVGAASV